ncbi:MAG: PQQ-binding-like beta-propeller repeat protein [Acidobacteriota bacterium]
MANHCELQISLSAAPQPRLRAPLIALAGLCLSLGALVTPAAADAGEDLIAAAQRQDLDTVRKMLADGVDVNSKSRYGATALFFASDKGNVELAELLLASGAEIDVTDTFYNANPLTWALFRASESKPHRDVVLLLVQHGSTNAPAALSFGARQGDLEMVQAVVDWASDGDKIDDSKLEANALRAALAAAKEGEHQEIVALLEPRTPAAEPGNAVELAPDVLATYVGDFKNNDVGVQIKVSVEDGVLKMQSPGQEAMTLEARGNNVFAARDVPNLDVTFGGRGGLIENFVLRQGGREFPFARVETGGEVEQAEVAAPPPLPKAERSAPIQWARFRGDGARGIGDGQGAPIEWDPESGRNVAWKTRVPGLAHASPVVWNDRIYLTSAVTNDGDESLRIGLYGDVDSVDDDSKHVWKVFALDKASGEILWQKTATEGVPQSKRHLKATHANPTPATDGKYLVAHFGSEGLYCYDLEGNQLWYKPFGVLASGWFFDSTYEWGFSSSPILHDGKVITQIDVDKGSFIAAYDLATGKELWKTERDEIPTWGTPVVLPAAGGDEIITNGTTIRGYHAENGKELWRLAPNSEVTVASPVVTDGVAYVTGGYPPVRPIYAIRPGGRGDLTLPEGETASDTIMWSQSRGGTYIPTPIVYRGILYMLHNNGRLTAHDAKTGELHYRGRVGKAGSYSSSPVAADGKLYFTSEDGTTYVVRAGTEYQELASSELGEVVMTTPAISDGHLLIRGAKHLYALSETTGAATAGDASGN